MENNNDNVYQKIDINMTLHDQTWCNGILLWLRVKHTMWNSLNDELNIWNRICISMTQKNIGKIVWRMYVKMTCVREERGGDWVGGRVMEKRERHRTPKQWCASVCACLCECHNMWVRAYVGGLCVRIVLCLQCMPVCCRNNQDNQNFCSPLLSCPTVATWESEAEVEVSNWPTCRSHLAPTPAPLPCTMP